MSTFRPRKKHRLQVELYAEPGAYFITVCAKDRKHMFGRFNGATLRLSPLGRIVERCWKAIPSHFPGVELDLQVVMPNHFHGVIFIKADSNLVKLADSPSIPRTMQAFKAAVTREARKEGIIVEQIWQTGYWDHVIRNEEDLYRIREYVQNNPLAWHLDRENPERTGLHPVYALLDQR